MTDAGSLCSRCSALEREVAQIRAENAALRAQIVLLQKPSAVGAKDQDSETKETPTLAETLQYSPFSRVELQRYGRQMLVTEFGANAQLKLRSARVLLIGVGGLGSPVAMYLAAMGIGTLALVDADHVDRSNLHRQILHDEHGAQNCAKKVFSAKKRLHELNPLVQIVVYPTRFTCANASQLVADYDVVVDASDNIETRYLLNDFCLSHHKPLISASALGFEGQVTVFTYSKTENATGCYRCLYPKPPQIATSCGENGVIGVVPGVIGCLQAMETVKVITGLGEPLVGVQCFYDAFDGQFRLLKLGKKKLDCISCGQDAKTTADNDLRTVNSLLLGEGSCIEGEKVSNDLKAEFRITTQTFAQIRQTEGQKGYILLDTRARTQFAMVHFPEAVNFPTAELLKQSPEHVINLLKGAKTAKVAQDSRKVFVICRRGIDSVKVTQWFLHHGIQNVYNVDGGYTEYAKDGGVDPNFPIY